MQVDLYVEDTTFDNFKVQRIHSSRLITSPRRLCLTNLPATTPKFIPSLTARHHKTSLLKEFWWLQSPLEDKLHFLAHPLVMRLCFLVLNWLTWAMGHARTLKIKAVVPQAHHGFYTWHSFLIPPFWFPTASHLGVNPNINSSANPSLIISPFLPKTLPPWNPRKSIPQFSCTCVFASLLHQT